MTRRKQTVLTRKQSRLLFSLASGATMTEAAKGAGCNRSYGYLMRDKPGFEDELRRLQQDALQRFAVELPALAESATTALKQILDTTWINANTRVTAAKLVVDLTAIVAAGQPDGAAPIDLAPEPSTEPEETA